MNLIKPEDLRIGQKIQWKIFGLWVEAIVVDLAELPDKIRIGVEFFETQGGHLDDGVTWKKGVPCRFIRGNKRIKATNLAKRMYPDAEEFEGYLEI